VLAVAESLVASRYKKCTKPTGVGQRTCQTEDMRYGYYYETLSRLIILAPSCIWYILDRFKASGLVKEAVELSHNYTHEAFGDLM